MGRKMHNQILFALIVTSFILSAISFVKSNVLGIGYNTLYVVFVLSAVLVITLLLMTLWFKGYGRTAFLASLFFIVCMLLPGIVLTSRFNWLHNGSFISSKSRSGVSLYGFSSIFTFITFLLWYFTLKLERKIDQLIKRGVDCSNLNTIFCQATSLFREIAVFIAIPVMTIYFIGFFLLGYTNFKLEPVIILILGLGICIFLLKYFYNLFNFK